MTWSVGEHGGHSSETFARYVPVYEIPSRYFQYVRSCPPALAREATEALAVHHEHRARDLRAARTFALRSLQLQATTARQEAVKYRLARIDRKMSSLFPLSP